MTVNDSLQRLSDALAGERQALIEHDIEGLMRHTQDKLAALRALEAEMPQGQEERLRELAEANRANGALLARRRREVNWALRHLGRTESAPAYDANGQSSTLRAGRSLAVA
ncbi:flagella protein [Xanthomonas maliensis]|uniref:flagella protein n=1 Tax=Xanthomonas maliensis TaxID=1321368 RepID=UPI0003B680E7|nr:flagella protein [Xanthomonas maliensis]KAB7771851.1 flagellar protein FlgN [Xanthomonas maliensis]